MNCTCLHSNCFSLQNAFVVKHARPFIALTGCIAVTAFVVGVLAILSQQGFFPHELRLIGSVGLGGGAGFLAAGTCASLFILFLAYRGIFKKTAKGEDVRPSSLPPLPKAEKTPASLTISKRVPTFGVMKHTTNFCYADSVFCALFLGFYTVDSYVQEAMSRPDLSTQQRHFFQHLWNKTICPIRQGQNVSVETMTQCQQLMWNAGWRGAETLTAQGDSAELHRFLFELLKFPTCICKDSLGEESLRLDVDLSISSFKRKLSDLSLRPFLKNQLTNFIKKELAEEEFTLSIPPLMAFSINRRDLQNPTNPPDSRFLQIEDEMELGRIFHHEDLERSSYSPKDRLCLRAIVNYNPGHYWSFFVREGNSENWLRYNDLYGQLEKIRFEEVANTSGKIGRIFYFDFMRSQINPIDY